MLTRDVCKGHKTCIILTVVATVDTTKRWEDMNMHQRFLELPAQSLC